MPRISTALILAAMVLAACGSATPTATGTAIATASATGATSTSTAASPAATGACPPASDVEPVIGPVTAQQGTATAALGGVCIFTSSDGGLIVTFTRAPTRADFENTVKVGMPGAQAESGVGDAAYSTVMKVPNQGPWVASLAMLKGSTQVMFQASSTSRDGAALLTALRPMARKVAGAL